MRCNRSRGASSRLTGILAFLVAALAGNGVVRADAWDLNLSRLCFYRMADGTLLPCGVPQDLTQHGGLAASNPIEADQESFRSLMSELGTIFAPTIGAPAQTIGWGSFSLGIDFGFMSINPTRMANRGDPEKTDYFWRASESVSDAALALPRTADGKSRIERELPPSIAPTMTIMARKGIWFPLPSMELGVGVKHLLGSRMWSGLLALKVALHEGFHGLPFPEVAIQGWGSRVFGTPGFDLSLAAVDAMISKTLGVGWTVSVAPYVGYQALWIIADSGLTDAFPGQPVSSLTDARYFTFINATKIFRNRLFWGARINFYLASLFFEMSFLPEGSVGDNQQIRAELRTVNIRDRAGWQLSFNSGLAVDF